MTPPSPAKAILRRFDQASIYLMIGGTYTALLSQARASLWVVGLAAAVWIATLAGVPDETWGEAVEAIVVAKPGAARDPADIIAWARARIAHYKAPKSVDFVDAIPRNITGKILRRQLREPYLEGAGAEGQLI
jgi:acyl-CoA synthetase (AMP-forming)/AMP-acid ligase II